MSTHEPPGARPAPLRTYDVDAPLELLADPVAQWLDWEEQANLVGFRTSTQPVEVDVVAVPRADVEVFELPGAPPAIVRRFVADDRVRIPRHPLNRDASVRWSDAPAAERWTARFTASRTLAMPGPESGSALFSVKLATDHPHPDFHQPEKTKLREEALDAVRWTAAIDRVDARLAPLEVAVLVREVLVVLERGGEAGVLVRDLRRFQTGGYFLPALSLPWVGRQIAARAGEDFAPFWERCYAAPIGRAKAELLVRYGLWYETPNPQNVVIELDARLAPTGRILFRDVGDGLCATDALALAGPDAPPWTVFTGELRPETQTSFWAFAESADHSVDAATLERWYRAHDDAYYGELARRLPALAPRDATASGRAPEALRAHWSDALRAPGAAAAVAALVARPARAPGGAP
ncbi:MAG: hypothetical protein R3E88_08255 [Myxococcota bacterium]